MTIAKKKLALTITGMLLGMSATQGVGSMDRGAISVGRIVHHPLLLAPRADAGDVEAFRPHLCAGNVPSAALLALAAWPLDAGGSGCEGNANAAPDAAANAVRPAAVMASNLADESGQRPDVHAPRRQGRATGQSVGLATELATGLATELATGQATIQGDVVVAGGASEVPGRVARVRVEVVERSWSRDAATYVDGRVRVNPVAEPGAPLRLALVEERSWHRPDAAPAAEPAAMPLIIAGANVVGEEAMDTLRGGFTTPDGLVLSFGIERVVYINGELASATRINVKELGNLTGGSAGIATVVPPSEAIGLIQSGSNNSFVGDVLSAGSFATVIQNSLDGQHIQTITTIDAQVNSMELMGDARFGESLRDALTFGR